MIVIVSTTGSITVNVRLESQLSVKSNIEAQRY